MRLKGFWGRWVVANAIGELLGLGLTAVVAVTALVQADKSPVWLALVFTFAVVLAGAVVEGLTVGWAQWMVLRRPLPSMKRLSWMVPTAIGAGIAWLLGMVPSTVTGLVQRGAPPAAAGGGGGMEVLFNGPLQYVLAALMGFVLGPILGAAQAFTLRRYVSRSWRWLLANAVAWAFGMPVVFLGAGNVPPSWPPAGKVAFAALTLLVAGAVVGAVHGWWLERMLLERTEERQAAEPA